MPQPGARGGADRSVQPHWQWLGGFCHCNGFSTEALEIFFSNKFNQPGMKMLGY